MATNNIREQLYQQIDRLPDEVVEQIADFTLFVMARRQMSPSYAEWGHNQWQAFTLEQFFQEDDEVEYTGESESGFSACPPLKQALGFQGEIE